MEGENIYYVHYSDLIDEKEANNENIKQLKEDSRFFRVKIIEKK